jgi:hypothetical protein
MAATGGRSLTARLRRLAVELDAGQTSLEQIAVGMAAYKLRRANRSIEAGATGIAARKGM